METGFIFFFFASWLNSKAPRGYRREFVLFPVPKRHLPYTLALSIECALLGRIHNRTNKCKCFAIFQFQHTPDPAKGRPVGPCVFHWLDGVRDFVFFLLFIVRFALLWYCEERSEFIVRSRASVITRCAADSSPAHKAAVDERHHRECIVMNSN